MGKSGARIRRAMMVGMAALGLPGCDEIDKRIDERVEARVAVRQKEIVADAEARVLAALDSRLIAIEEAIRLQKFSDSMLWDANSAANHSYASVSSDDKGYSVARTAHGPIIVNVESVAPNLDGVKVKLRIGNPTNMTLRGAKADVKWGPAFEKGLKFDEWSAAQREKTINLSETFLPGSYTDVEVVLLPARPEDVRTIKVRLSFNTVSLRLPQETKTR